jgi:elongation factor Ts
VTAEGLIGVYSTNDKSLVAMLEVNCETDFVARNQLFTQLVSSLTQRLSETSIATQHSDNGNLSKIRLGLEELSQLGPELVVDAIGKLGENIRLSKASVLVNNKVEERVQLIGYTHAVGGRLQTTDDSLLLGKYGTIVALKAGIH